MDVLYAGDNEQTTNHLFAGAESFQVYQGETKDYQPLQSALSDESTISVDHLTGREAIKKFPKSNEELAEYDVVVLSDISRDTLLPHFLPDAVPGPNRPKLIKNYVSSGGALLYCGGYMSYQGYHGRGNWHDSHVADILPIEILPVPDDRVDTPEGVDPTIKNTEHPVTQSINENEFPTVYGYNKTGQLKSGAELLATVDTNNLLAAGQYNDGRVLAYTSDPSRKWGLNLIDWEGYQDFWQQGLHWLSNSA